MSKQRRRTLTLKWKNLAFIPEGYDESRMITRGEPGFLYLCRLLRDDWRQLRGYAVKDLKFRPGTGGCSASYDWTGLDDALLKPGADVESPSKTIAVKAQTSSADERESLGRTAHQNWVAVRKQQRADGQAVPYEDLQGWVELFEEKRELFRRSGETLALRRSSCGGPR